MPGSELIEVCGIEQELKDPEDKDSILTFKNQSNTWPTDPEEVQVLRARWCKVTRSGFSFPSLLSPLSDTRG